jgi:hypothetical protein
MGPPCKILAVLRYLILQLKLHVYARERVGDLISVDFLEGRLTFFEMGEERRLAEWGHSGKKK